jgi:acyl-CoA thioesterase I
MVTGLRPADGGDSMRLSMRFAYGHCFAAVEGGRRLFVGVFQRLLILTMAGGILVTVPASAQAPSGKPIKLVVLGDSLSAGLGLPAAAAFPARLQKALKDKGIEVDMVNAGVSGDTTSGGLERLDWSVADGTDAVIIELGANDALRGIDPQISRAALGQILTRLKARNIAVLLCGMLAPPNYGTDYSARFDAIYPELAKQYQVPLYPFFLQGVAGDPRLNQADGIHPTAEGVDIIVSAMLPSVEAFVGAKSGQRS